MQNTYQYYKSARDASWKALIECGIKSLPVDLLIIAKYYGIEIEKYSDCDFGDLVKAEILSSDDFITMRKGKKVIFINDKIKTRGRDRKSTRLNSSH